MVKVMKEGEEGVVATHYLWFLRFVAVFLMSNRVTFPEAAWKLYRVTKHDTVRSSSWVTIFEALHFEKERKKKKK